MVAIIFQLSSCYLFKSIACNSLEGLLHVDCLLSAGFKIWDVVLALTPSLCSLGCDLKHKERLLKVENKEIVCPCKCLFLTT